MMKLFLAGDVMTGRGIDQVLPQSVDPILYEPYVRDARIYVALAEEAHGKIPAPVPYDYVWGEALAELARVGPDARIVNLETAVTTSGDWWRGKGIHYRMHPGNVAVLTAAGIDVCVLANNHVMDWGIAGLRETLTVLRSAGLGTVGAGANQREAARPAVLTRNGSRLRVFAYASPTAGVPTAWAAGPDRPGVNLLSDLGPESARRVTAEVQAQRQSGDLVVVSLHWGGNWGYLVPPEQRSFAHQLIDAGAADVVYGHSSHHPKGLEVYRKRLILYGCGDFINDYEGISGHEAFRGDLTLMYFVTLSEDGALQGCELIPLQLRRFRLQRPAAADIGWLQRTLDRESRLFGTRVLAAPDGRLEVRWR